MFRMRSGWRQHGRKRSAAVVLPMLVSSLLVLFAVNPAVAQADPTGGADGARWTADHDRNLRYPEVNVQWDVPIRMSDGTIIRANIYRPADANRVPVNTKTPVIVNMTPYTKLVSAVASAAMANPVLGPFALWLANAINVSGTPISGLNDILRTVPGGVIQNFSVDFNLVRAGYTQVVADVRGTGNSDGTWQVFQPREQQDTLEVIDWAAKQRWSDGKVGMTGVSYSGINQLYAANKNPKALKAIVPIEPGGDLVRDVVAPGGALGVGFLPLWLMAVNTLKMVPDLRSMVTGTFDWNWLAGRVSDPFTFFPQLIQALTAPTVQSVPPEMKRLLSTNSVERQSWLDHADQIKVPTMIYDGWWDLFTNSVPRVYGQIPLSPGTEKQLIMGPTYHMTATSGMGQVGAPPSMAVLQKAWFDHFLKGVKNGITKYGPATLYQQGNGWTSAPSFPRPGMDSQRLYLSDRRSGTAPTALRDGSLVAAKPDSNARFTVAPGLSTLCSRDSGQQSMGQTAIFPFCTTDNRIAETNGLTFTSAPMAANTALSGPVNVHLNTVLDATDGYYTAMLTDVAPDGTSTPITTGQLVASLRAIDRNKSTFAPNGDVTNPYYTLDLADRKPVKPGQPTQIDLGMWPTDALIKKGHRLRVAVFAMNLMKGLPLRPLLNDSQLRPEHIQLDPNNPSFVSVPLNRQVGQS